jgi:ankyrin repeat protein
MEDRRERLTNAIRQQNMEATGAILDEDETVMEQHDTNEHTALMAAAHMGHAGIVGFLLGRGADVSALGGWNGELTALKLAAGRGHLDVVNLLLEHGARVRDGHPYDALYEACTVGHLAVVERLLLENGGLQDGHDNVALITQASLSGSLDVLKAILWAGACSSGNMASVARVIAASSDGTELVSLLQVSNWSRTTQHAAEYAR